MALYQSPDYQTSFESNGLSVQDKTLNIHFQDGSHGAKFYKFRAGQISCSAELSMKKVL